MGERMRMPIDLGLQILGGVLDGWVRSQQEIRREPSNVEKGILSEASRQGVQEGGVGTFASEVARDDRGESKKA